MCMIATLVVWRNITVTLACTIEKDYLEKMWYVSVQSYSVELILYIWPRYKVDIDLCSRDARPWSLDSDTGMNCAISLTSIHISFPCGHRNHTRTLRISLPPSRLEFIFLPRPTSLSHRNTHTLSVEHAHPFNSAHPPPLMSQSIIVSHTYA